MNWYKYIYISRLVKLSLCIGPEDCETLKGDSRSTPGQLNTIPGNHMNLFRTLTVPKSGQVTQLIFYARTPRNVFVSFWKPTGTQHGFEMESKILVVNDEHDQVVRENSFFEVNFQMYKYKFMK